ncbi:MAG: hypothetical protein ABR962_02830 [Candidatus Bathyarchaeia archaeon]
MLKKYSKTSDIVELAKDLVETAENRRIEYDPEKSGFVDDTKWQELHRGQPADQWDAAHVISDNGFHCVIFRKSAFDKKRSQMDSLQFKIYVLETAIHEFFHVLGYRADAEIDEKTRDVLKKFMDIGAS